MKRAGMDRPLYGIDAGGSRTSVCAWNGDRWTAPPLNPSSVGREESDRRLSDLLARLRQHADRARGSSSEEHERPVIWLASASVGQATDGSEAGWCAAAARGAGLHAELLLSNDVTPLLLGAPVGTGHVIAVSGTGSGFLATDGMSPSVRIGGCEYLGSDEGSAFDLGLRGLRAAVRGLDGRGRPTTLSDLLAKHGKAPVPLLARELAQLPFPKSAVAALAPIVLRAWLEGDLVAANLVDEAIAELVLGVRAARDAAGLSPGWRLSVTGGTVVGCREFFGRLVTEVAHIGTDQVELIDDPAAAVLTALRQLTLTEPIVLSDPRISGLVCQAMISSATLLNTRPEVVRARSDGVDRISGERVNTDVYMCINAARHECELRTAEVIRSMRDILTALPEDDWAVPKLLLTRYGVLCDRLAFLIIRPEAVRQGYSLRILGRTAELGFAVVAAKVIRPHPRQVEELYRYTQIRLMGAGNRPLWSYTPRYYRLGPAVAILLKGDFSGRMAAEVLNEAKGPSVPALTVPGQLRYDFGSQNMVMCVIHSSDDTEAVMREASIFFNQEILDRVLSAGPIEPARHLIDVEELLVAEGLPVHPQPRSSFHQVLARVQADIVGRLSLPQEIGGKLADPVKGLLLSMAEGELGDLSYVRRTSALRRLWDSENARRLLQVVDKNDDLGVFLSWSARLEHTGQALMDQVISVLRARGVYIDEWDEITLDTGFGFHSLIMAHFAPSADDASAVRAVIEATRDASRHVSPSPYTGPPRIDVSDDLIFDGHDGAGKSTLARLAAKELGGVYVEPFHDSLGEHMDWLWKRGQMHQLNTLALSAVERMVELHPRSPRVFDRHWASMFSILPEEYWPEWKPVPITVVCHADAATTYRRLEERGEDPLDLALHHKYQMIYSKLGERFDALVLDTSHLTVEWCLAAALDFYRARMGRANATG